MKSVAQHAAPNIVPGVNLTAARFAEIFAWISSLCADTAFSLRRPYQYGLLLSYDGKPSLLLEKTGQQLVLSRCAGITPAGTLIGFFDDIQPEVVFNLAEREMRPQEEYAVWVETMHQPRRAFGADAPDLPSRPLHTAPDVCLQVQLRSQQTAAAPDAFCVGILRMELGEWLLADYVPPCAHIGADNLLRERYRAYTEKIEEWLHLFPQIIVNTDAYHEKSMVELREFTVQLGSFLASQRHRYRHFGEGGLPFEVFDFWASFARQTSFLLQCLKDRAGFYNLLNENTRQRNGVYFTAHSWDDAIQNMANLRYDHQDIKSAIQITDQFLENVGPIFQSLAYGVEQVRKRTGWEEEKRKDYTTW